MTVWRIPDATTYLILDDHPALIDRTSGTAALRWPRDLSAEQLAGPVVHVLRDVREGDLLEIDNRVYTLTCLGLRLIEHAVTRAQIEQWFTEYVCAVDAADEYPTAAGFAHHLADRDGYHASLRGTGRKAWYEKG